ncbi:MAG: hypothetical protein LQ340_005028 [Diploschistes diacapsis]|nr:MAG: hypothetical protein LQ340_005028 [Diploschistes diacapsis]
MEETRIAERVPNGPEGSLVGGKSLKKKKSLKQLFIPSRQKSQKSRTPPSSGLKPPNAHSLGDHPLPSKARSLSTTPAKTFSVMFNERIPGLETNQNRLHSAEPLRVNHEDNDIQKAERARAYTTQDFSRTAAGRRPIPHDQTLSSQLDNTSKTSPRSPTYGSHDVSPRSLQRSVTEGAGGMTMKPATYIPKFGPQPLESPTPSQTTPRVGEPLSFELRHSQVQSSSTRVSSYGNLMDKEVHLPEQCQRIAWNPVFDVRESIISGQSTGSSLLDSTSTKHSSVFTKDSALTDTTIDAEGADESKYGMTVDDAIDLYIKGFHDDDIPEDTHTAGVHVEEEVPQRSSRIAEAMGDTIGSVSEAPGLSHPGGILKTSSAAAVSETAIQALDHRPPPLQRPTATHDQYGFKKASRDVSIEAYDTWHSKYSPYQERRNDKWRSWLQSQGLSTGDPAWFPTPSTKTQRFIRKGVPPARRGEVWFFYSGGNEFLLKRPGHYSRLVEKCQTPALSAKDREAIERDLHRTFPENIHFKPQTAGNVSDNPLSSPIETPILSALRRLLSAFAIDHPAIGYCQSLNFIAGLLLLFLPEEKAFWMLHVITTRLLPGSHEESLEGTDVDTWVLMLALKDQNPGIWAKVGGDVHSDTRYLPDISMCTTSWFMSVFIGNLPIEGVLRVWDVLFYEGSKTLFRIALAIFRCGEEGIKRIQDPMETLQVIQTLPRKMLDVGDLFETAFGRGEVGKKWIEKKRLERKEYHIKRRAAERARKESGDFARKGSDSKSLKDMPSPSMIGEEEEPMPSMQPASTKGRHRHWFGKGNVKERERHSERYGLESGVPTLVTGGGHG